MSEYNQEIEIRDLREEKWAWTEKSVIFSKHVSNAAFRLYMAISTYANNHTQKARPSLAALSEKLPLGRTTAFKAKRELEDLGLLTIEERPGRPHVYTLLKVPEEIKPPKNPKKKASPNANMFNELIEYFIENGKRLRGVPVQITAADKSMLGKALNKLNVSQNVFEQLMIYFLAAPRYKTLSPSIRVFLSSTVINGLMNDMKNRADFWKDLEHYAFQYRPNRPIEEERPIDQRETMYGVKSLADILGIKFTPEKPKEFANNRR